MLKTNRREFVYLLSCAGLSSCSRQPNTPFPVLEVAGSPGDLGLVQGRTFGDRIRANLSFYLDWLSHSGRVPADELLALASRFGPVLGEHFPDMLEEIDGVARGAGLSLAEVLLINSRTDIAAVVEARLTVESVPACTALALHGERFGQAALTLSQNWDWDPALADAPVILKLRPKNGPRIMTLVEAGMIGKIGFNEHRLGVCLNFLSHTADGDPGDLGVPIHCLLRAAMNSSDIDEAVTVVDQSPRCASANFLLAQHGDEGPRVTDLEIAPHAVAAIDGADRDLVHTNHYLDPRLATGCTSGRGPSTMTRFATAERLVRELDGSIEDPVRRSQQVLESRDELPFPISRQHNPDPSSSTLAGIIMDLSRNRMLLTRGAPHMAAWVELDGI